MKSIFISLIVSQQKLSFHLPSTLLSLKTSYPLGFWPSLSSPLVCFSNPSFFMHFTHLDLRFFFLCEIFGVFENFWISCEIFGLGVMFLMLYDHALHSICIFTMFHAFRCVFICWKLCADRFGLRWTHNEIFFFFFAYHMFMNFFHAYVPFLFYLLVLCCDGTFLFVSFYLSLR